MGFVSLFFCFPRGLIKMFHVPLGLVNYISSPGATAFDRSLSLAESIIKNGV